MPFVLTDCGGSRDYVGTFQWGTVTGVSSGFCLHFVCTASPKSCKDSEAVCHCRRSAVAKNLPGAERGGLERVEIRKKNLSSATLCLSIPRQIGGTVSESEFKDERVARFGNKSLRRSVNRGRVSPGRKAPDYICAAPKSSQSPL